MTTDRYDPWPTRLGIIVVGLIGMGAVATIAFLKATGEDVTGLITIPISAIMTIAILIPKRPPWTAPGRFEKTQPTEEER